MSPPIDQTLHRQVAMLEARIASIEAVRAHSRWTIGLWFGLLMLVAGWGWAMQRSTVEGIGKLDVHVARLDERLASLDQITGELATLRQWLTSVESRMEDATTKASPRRVPPR